MELCPPLSSPRICISERANSAYSCRLPSALRRGAFGLHGTWHMPSIRKGPQNMSVPHLTLRPGVLCLVHHRICCWEQTEPSGQLVMSSHSSPPPLMAASCSPRSLGTDHWVVLSFLATKHYYCTRTEQVKAIGQERDLGWARGP